MQMCWGQLDEMIKMINFVFNHNVNTRVGTMSNITCSSTCEHFARACVNCLFVNGSEYCMKQAVAVYNNKLDDFSCAKKIICHPKEYNFQNYSSF